MTEPTLSNQSGGPSGVAGDGGGETFTRITPPRRVGPDALAAMADGSTVEDLPDDEYLQEYRRYYAVARVDGVLSYGPTVYDSTDACRVLYIDAMADHAIEHEYRNVEGDWSGIPQSVLLRRDSSAVRGLAPRHAEKFAPVLAVHRDGVEAGE